VLAYSFAPIFFGGTASKALSGTALPNATMTDSDGKTHALHSVLDSTKAKHILINFWATWCEPCLKELPLLSKAQSVALKREREIVLVNYDGGLPEKTRNQVSAWVISENVGIPTLFDFEEELLRLLKVEGLPFSMIIEQKTKRILWAKLGELSQRDIQFFLNSENF
jgi:thiol-disulfide isomerase/thioredoxin